MSLPDYAFTPPATEVHASAPEAQDRASLVVIIPARNEEATVGGVVREIKALLGCEVVVVDDASTDATVREALQAGARVLSLALQLNAWGAIQAGLRFARRQGYQLAVTLDADGQHLPQSIPALLVPILEGRAEVVIGAYPQRGSQARKLAWQLFRKLTGLSLEDLTSGLRVYATPAIQALASTRASLLDYQDLGVLLLLQHNGFRIAETPVIMLPRPLGKSRIFHSWFMVLRYMWQTVILCLAKSDWSLRPTREQDE